MEFHVSQCPSVELRPRIRCACHVLRRNNEACSSEIHTPPGPYVRIGALDEAGKIVDLEAAYRRVPHDAGATCPAERIASALFPASMVGFIQGGRTVLNRGDVVEREASSHLGTLRNRIV